MQEFDFPNVSTDLSGQTALVTGATSGLGWHFARVLAKAGARVAATGRREAKLRELEQTIAQDGGECIGFTMDVMDAENIFSVVERIENALGTVTILVNNAGIPGAQRATKMSVELIDRVIGANLRGPWLLSCEIARRLLEKKMPGRIVNLSSLGASVYDGNGAALYCTTKAAVSRMSETLAVEWSRFNINVNAIAPGLFHSEMTGGMLARTGDVSGHFPRKRIGHPAQLDSTLLYLCSPVSDCVTGTVIKVDDGQGTR